MPHPGLYACGSDSVERLDDLASTGLCLDPQSGSLYRVLHGPHPPNGPAEILRYDLSGLTHYRVDEVQDPHSIAVDDKGRLLAVSTFTNEVLWLDGAGDVCHRWSISGEPDSWHLNSIFLDGPTVYVSALGGTRRYREYGAHVKNGRGVVFELPSGCPVVTGISSPHNPIRLGDRWIICESGHERLVELGESHPAVRVRSVDLAGWTRGLAVSSDYIFVGESASRLARDSGTASVAVVDRHSLKVVDRWNLPCAEIYDLLIVPVAVAERVAAASEEVADLIARGEVRRSWRTPTTDAAERLDPAECRIRIDAVLPEAAPAGSLLVIECAVHNTSTTAYPHLGEKPVHLSYRWFRHEEDGADSLSSLVSLRMPFVEPLLPGMAVLRRILVRCPDDEGMYELVITAVQENVCWFDDIGQSELPRALVNLVAAEDSGDEHFVSPDMPSDAASEA
jgi:acetolactate synthase I/II/III large subunit